VLLLDRSTVFQYHEYIINIADDNYTIYVMNLIKEQRRHLYTKIGTMNWSSRLRRLGLRRV